MKHLLDPRRYEMDNSAIFEWRQHLKKQLLIERHYLSDWSGLRMIACDMHEGIITRGNVPKSLDWQWQIFHPYNSFLLMPEEHYPNPPSRAWCAVNAFERYGKDNVVEWFYSLPWKRVPFRVENLDELLEVSRLRKIR